MMTQSLLAASHWIAYKMTHGKQYKGGLLATFEGLSINGGRKS